MKIFMAKPSMLRILVLLMFYEMKTLLNEVIIVVLYAWMDLRQRHQHYNDKFYIEFTRFR